VVCLGLGFGSLGALAQSTIVNWVGGNTYKNWSQAANWDKGVVPTNGPTGAYTVFIPSSTSVTFDLVGDYAIDALNFTGALRVGADQRLTVNGVSVVGGLVEATGANALFSSPGANATFGPNARLSASAGAEVEVLGRSYLWNYNPDRWSPVVFTADGAGSVIDTPALETLRTPYDIYNGSYRYYVIAKNGGWVNLPALSSLEGVSPGNDNWLEFQVASGGRIDLPALKQTSGQVYFNVDVPLLELPSLETAASTYFDLADGSALRVPRLRSMTGGHTVLIPAGARFDAPVLASMSGVTLDLRSGGEFLAPVLTSFTSGYLALAAGETLQVGALDDITTSRFVAEGGASLAIGAKSYLWSYNPDRWSPVIFTADGAGSLIDAGRMESIRTPYDIYNGSYRYYIVASNNGKVDLSSLTSVEGVAPGNDNWLEFEVSNGGEIDLRNLNRTTGQVAFDVDIPELVLPALETAANASFSLAPGRRLSLPALKTATQMVMTLSPGAEVHAPQLTTASWAGAGAVIDFNASLVAPELTSFSGASLDLRIGGRFSAPKLTSLTYSYLALGAGETLETGALGDVTASRFAVNDGRVLILASTNYVWPYNPDRWSPVILSADGAGSTIEAKAMQTLRTPYDIYNGAYYYYVVADNGGKIDLSGLVAVEGVGVGNDNWLEFQYGNGGAIDLSSLQRSTGQVRFNIGVPLVEFPALTNASSAYFDLGAGSELHVPALLSMSGSNSRMTIRTGSKVAAGSLESMDRVDLDLGSGGIFVAPNLTRFTYGYLALGPGEDLQVGVLDDVTASRFSVEGGKTLASAAKGYLWPYNPDRWSPVIFSANGAGSEIDASAMESFRTPYDIYNGAYYYYVQALNNARINLRSLTSIEGVAAGNDNWLNFDVATGGEIAFGRVTSRGQTYFSGAGSQSVLSFADLNLLSPGGHVYLQLGARLTCEGSFRFDHKTESSFNLTGGSFVFRGNGRQRMEIGGEDQGPSGFTTGNFGMGRLVVGEAGHPTTLRLVDELDNGNRGTAGGREALYLFGIDGRGLEVTAGSVLIAGSLNVYAAVNGTMTHLNALIPAGRNAVAFGDGILATTAGAAVTSCVPTGRVLPPIAAVDLAFDIPIDPVTFTAADVQLTGPGGVIPIQSITDLGGNAYRLAFASQSAGGSYQLRVGPAIADASGLLPSLDQDGDGVAGEAGEDVFTASFFIDVQAPAVASAASLAGSGRVGVCFDEILAASSVADTNRFTINGTPAAKATLRPDGRSVELEFPGLVGDGFTLALAGMVDPLGNTADLTVSGPILTLQSQDIGSPGSNPRERGSAFTCDGLGFDVVAGGLNVWGTTSDGFHYVYESRAGDFDVQVRVESLVRKNTFTTAGLMARETTAGGSRSLFVGVSPPDGGNQYFTIVRSTAATPGAAWPGEHDLAGVTFPNAWVRLRREGDVFSAYRSSDGATWTEIGRITMALPGPLLLGMATTAHNNDAGQSTQARYSGYGDLGPSIVIHPQNQTVASGANVTLAVTARGQPPLTYQWRFDGADLPSATASTLSLNPVTTEQAGPYLVVVANAFGAVTSQVARVVVDGAGSEVGGFEADVAPRPDGNNTVSIADWAQVGRFVANLDTPGSLPEFVRADCAPAATRGNGLLTVADWTQAGRYAAALDATVPAGGPTAPSAPGLNGESGERRVALLATEASTTLALVPEAVSDGILLRVVLEGRGWENALGFSVVFDPQRAAVAGIEPGADLDGAMFQVNDRAAASGRVGLAVARSIGESFAAGRREIARLRFTSRVGDEALRFAFGDQPVLREAVDVLASTRPAAFVGAVWGRPAAAGVRGVRWNAGGRPSITLTGVDGFEHALEASDDLVTWRELARGEVANGVLVLEDDSPPRSRRFYRARAVTGEGANGAAAGRDEE
jgi:hypothetical protein